MKVKFKSTDLDIKQGKSKKTGNEYYMATQQGLVTFDDETIKIAFNVPRDSQPFSVGEHEVDVESSITYSMDNFGNKFLTLKRDLVFKKSPVMSKAS